MLYINLSFLTVTKQIDPNINYICYMNVLCIGNINLDVISHIPEYPESGKPVDTLRSDFSIGGSAVNTGRILNSSDNISVSLLGFIGNDIHTPLIKNKLKEEYESVRFINRDQENTICQCLINGQDEVSFINTNPPHFDNVELPNLSLSKYDHIHTVSYDANLAESIIKDFDGSVSFNPSINYHTSDDSYDNIVKKSDYTIVNEYEIEDLPIESIQCCIQTNGNKPTKVYEEGELKFSIMPERKQDIVDTLGAGDAFISGFLNSILKGNSLEDSVNFGHEVGQKCLYSVGPISEF